MTCPTNFITASLASYFDLYDFYLNDLTVVNKKEQIECLGKKIEDFVRSSTFEVFTPKIGEDVACFNSLTWLRGKVLNVNKKYAVVFLTDEGRPKSFFFGQYMQPLTNSDIVNIPAIGIIHCSLYGVVPIQDENNEINTSKPRKWPESTKMLALKYMNDSTTLEFMKVGHKEPDLWTGHVKMNTRTEGEIHLADFLVSEKLAAFGDSRNMEITPQQTTLKLPLLTGLLPSLSSLNPIKKGTTYSYMKNIFNKDINSSQSNDSDEKSTSSKSSTNVDDTLSDEHSIHREVVDIASSGEIVVINEISNDQHVQNNSNTKMEPMSTNSSVNENFTLSDENVQNKETSKVTSLSSNTSVEVMEIPHQEIIQNIEGFEIKSILSSSLNIIETPDENNEDSEINSSALVTQSSDANLKSMENDIVKPLSLDNATNVTKTSTDDNLQNIEDSKDKFSSSHNSINMIKNRSDETSENNKNSTAKFTRMGSSSGVNVTESDKRLKKNDNNKKETDRNLRTVIRNQLENTKDRTILSHGSPEGVAPIDNISNSPFIPEVHDGLNKMNIRQVYTLQAYAWRLIMQGSSVIMVAPSSSGKSYAYLPCICTLVTFGNVHGNKQGQGPIGLILTTSSSVDSMYMRCMHLAQKTTRIIRAPSWREKGLAIDLVNGCDILITTPVTFLKLITESNVTNVARICHLILDGVMDFENNYTNEIKAIINKINAVRESIQIVTASENWSSQVFSLLNTRLHPHVLIGDHLESAVYGNVNFKFELIRNVEKGARVIEIIKSNIKKLKMLIICKSTAETDELSSLLNSQSIDHQVANEDMDRQEIEETHAYWGSNASKEFFGILICTELLIYELIIKDVYWLIHYSLPDSWSIFRRRFSTMLQNYPQKTGKDVKLEINKCHSYLLIDENNTEQLPRFVNFLERMNCDIAPEIYNIAKQETIKRETNLAMEGIPLCEHVQSTGKCSKRSKCKERHLLTLCDKPQSHLPTSGEVKFIVLKVHKTNHYLVRLLEHRKPGGKWDRIKEELHVEWSMKTYFSSIEQERMHGIPKLGDICAIKSDYKYLRCRIIQIVSRNQFNEPTKVKVYLLDEGHIWEHIVADLIEIPETIQNKPPEVVNIRLAGIKPCDGDDDWISEAPVKVAGWLRFVDNNDEDYICAEISLALDNTLWVNKLSISQDIGSRCITKLSVNNNLVESGIALKNPEHMSILFKMCNDAGIKLPMTSEVVPVEKAVVALQSNSQDVLNSSLENVNTTDDELEVISDDKLSSEIVAIDNSGEYQIAKLDILNEERVEFILADSPNQIFVRVYKDEERFNILEADIQNYINGEPVKISKFNMNVGDLCVAQSPQDTKFHRARIISIHSNTEAEDASFTIEVFFVDFGDLAKVDEIFQISSKFISSVDFQAIECRLIGVFTPDDQIDYATDFLYNTLTVGIPKYAKAIRVEEQSKATEGNKYSIVLTTNFDGVITNINSQLIFNGWGAAIASEEEFLQQTSIENNLDRDNKNDKAVKDPFSLFWNQYSSMIEMDDNIVFPKVFKDITSENKKIKLVSSNNLEVPSNNKNVLKVSDSLSPIQEDNVYKRNIPNDYEKMPRLSPITYNSKVTWEQDEDHITLKIHLVGIDDYSLLIDTNLIYFKVQLQDKEYPNEVFLNLFGGVVPYKTKHEAKGLYVQIKCVKLISGKMWRRLTFTNKRPKWLTTECNHYKEERLESEREGYSKIDSDESSYSDSETDHTGSDIDDNLFDCLAD